MEVVDPFFKSIWARLHGTGPCFQNIEFRRCSMQCHFGNRTKEPRFRPVVRNVWLLNCTVYASFIGPIVLEDVLVENCNTFKFVFLYGAAFKHVVLRGRIGSMSLKSVQDRQRTDLWQAANEAYYADVDWALDLREAEVSELDLHGVPARLIRRDPASQVVITRARALAGGWQEIVGRGAWEVAIKWFLEDPAEQDLVLVAPKRHRRYREHLEILQRLREAGVAEPD
jgi:hypothetical protein